MSRPVSWQQRRRAAKRARLIRTVKISLLCLLPAALIAVLAVWLFKPVGQEAPSSSPVSDNISVSEPASSQTDALPESSVPVPSLPSSEEESDPLASYGSVAREEADLSTGDLIIVNEENGYMVEPDGLVTIASTKTNDYMAKNYDIQLRDYVMPYLNEMMADFRAATGIGNVVILSSYRSVEYQKGLYEQDLARTGRDYSDSVTKPGHSEHHTGLTFDLAYVAADGSWPFYDGHGDYGWINENCWKYGFIIRYPEGKQDVTGIIPEPWHFRFIGQAHAEMVTKSGLCYEEYMEMLHGHTVENPYRFSGENGSWEVYYVPFTGGSMEVPVPKDRAYTISGSNEGGFIITADINS